MAPKSFSKTFLHFYRFLRRRLANPLTVHRRSPPHCASSHSKQQKPWSSFENLSDQTVVMDVEGGLLRSPSIFPYFMLVALEAGSFVRGLLLLLLYPVIACLSQQVGLRVMVMVSFFGLRKDTFRAGKAVLPKFFLEDVGLEGFEVLKKGGRKVCVTALPRVMVEEFLKDYLGVEVVVGRELKVYRGYYIGLMEKEEEGGLKGLGEKQLGGGALALLGFGSGTKATQHPFISCCKEVHLVSEAEKSNWHALPREDRAKPLVFHDGRLAFRPTTLATLAMFLWLPFGVPLSIFRCVVCILLPCKICIAIEAATGMRTTLLALPTSLSPNTQTSAHGHLYVCNHRTLLDPVYISAVLNKDVAAVTYSLSCISEGLSPIRTVRLTRNKEEDRRRMEELLRQGDLAVCPEGTTCREPYLLRFSPLFTELTDEVIPVALVCLVDMFYGTTAAGFKFLDPFFFLMNPCPEYTINVLGKISTGSLFQKGYSSKQIANHVQGEIGKMLGFECTQLTRKDKYLMLAGTEGIVNAKPKKQST